MKSFFLSLVLLSMSSVCYGQCPQGGCPYTTVPPLYIYQYQPPPVNVVVVPRPEFYTKTTRHPLSIFNIFKPWTPIYKNPNCINCENCPNCRKGK